MTDKQLEKYMRGTYLGVVKGNYDTSFIAEKLVRNNA